MQLTRNPNADKHFIPVDYEDLGWQVHGHPKQVECKSLGHKLDEFDSSTYLFRGTHIVYACHKCKYAYHIDMSD